MRRRPGGSWLAAGLVEALLLASMSAMAGDGDPPGRWEHAAMRAFGWVSSATTPHSRAPWAWPLPGAPPVVHTFDPPELRWLRGHRGVDLGGWVGSPVTAVDDGEVSYSGTIAGVGIVTVRHTGGLRSTYQPVEDRVEEGTRVGRGELLGTLDSGSLSHCLLRTCLHLGAIRDKDTYVDPLLLLGQGVLSLLRLDE